MSDSTNGFSDDNVYDNLLMEFERQLKAGGEPDIGIFIAKCLRADRKSSLFVELLTRELERAKANGALLSDKVKSQYKIMYGHFKSEIEQVWVALDKVDPRSAANNNMRANDEPRSSRPPAIDGNLYKFEQRIGEGKFGQVWRAEHVMLEIPRAIKILNWEFKERQSLLLSEAQKWQGLHDSRIVAVYHVGLTTDSQVFIEMEFVPHTLREVMERTSFSGVRDAAPLLKKIAEAVQYLHGKGINHFDLKPENILLDESNNPKVGDFGLAVHHSDRGAGMNRSVGTPAYMAPEMKESGIDGCDERADIWSLGVILYELLIGELPFTNWEQINGEWRPSPHRRNPAISHRLEEICLRCWKHDPADRYQSAGALAKALAEACVETDEKGGLENTDAPVLTQEQMISLLGARRETTDRAYWRELPTRGHKTCLSLNLLKDLVAIANVGGGVIVFGVEIDGDKLLGIHREASGRLLDQSDIAKAIDAYLGDVRVSFRLTFFNYKNKEFCFLSVGSVQRPLVFFRPAECEVCGKQATSNHFSFGSAFIRQGTRTVQASDSWLARKVSELSNANSSGTLMNNLPSRDSIYDTFVGRTEPFEEAIKKLHDERRRVTWIQGSGGIGKTALAYHLAESVVSDASVIPGIDYVVWISAKENVLTLNGMVPIVPTLTSIADVVRAMADATGLVDVPANRIDDIKNAADAIRVLRPLVNDLTGLLVLDNLETLQDNEVLLLLQSLPGKTRALATTRECMDRIGGETILLEPMGLKEAADLIEFEAMRTRHTWLTGDPEAIRKVMELSGCIPLAIRLIVPRLDSSKSLKNYLAAAPKHQKDLLDFCYEQTFVELEISERRLFFALSMFDEPASLGDLAFVCGIDLNDPTEYERFQVQIGSLLHLSLAVRNKVGIGAHFEMQSLVRRFATGRLATDAKLRQDLRKALGRLEARKEEDLLSMAEKAKREFKESGDYEGAMETLEACLARDSQSVPIWLSKAEIELWHGQYPRRAADAAREVRRRTEAGSREWLRATEILAQAEISAGEHKRALELLSEIGEGVATYTANILIADCYWHFASAEAEAAEQTSANRKEAARFARKAAKQAHRANNAAEEAQACAFWAKVALEFSPAIAYQAANRALEMRAGGGTELRDIRERARARLDLGVPKVDLLELDS